MMRPFITFMWACAFVFSSFASDGEGDAFLVNGAPWHSSQETFEVTFSKAFALTLCLTESGITITPLDEGETEGAYGASQKMLQDTYAHRNGTPFYEEGYLYAPATIDPEEGLLLGDLPPNVPFAALLFTRSPTLSALEEGCLVGPMLQSPHHTPSTPLTALMFDCVTLYRTMPTFAVDSPFREGAQESPLPHGVWRVLLDKKF